MFPKHHPTETDDLESNDCLWHVTFKLIDPAKRGEVEVGSRTAGEDISLDDHRLDELCVLLRQHHALVSVGRMSSVYVTLFWRARTATDAFVPAEDTLLKAMCEAGMAEYQVVDARMVDVSGAKVYDDDSTEEPSPTRLISLNDLADQLKLSRQRVSALYREQKLPRPIAMIGRSPGWLPSQFSKSGRAIGRP